MYCDNLQVKCHRPEVGRTFSASLCSRNAHGHVTRAILRGNLQLKGSRPRARQTRTARVARACVVEMHMDVRQLG